MSDRLSKFLNSIKKEEVPFVLITHDSCFDGTGAVLAVFAFCDNHKIERPKVVPMQYGDKLDMSEYADFNVLITDFSFDRNILVELEYVTHDLFVIDHHSSAEKELDGLEYCHFDMEHSGASLTWMLLNNEVPELIKYIEDRDLWLWKMYKSKELSAALNLIAKDDYETLLKGIKQGATFTSKLITQGEPIVAYQDAIINKVSNKLKDGKILLVTFEGYRVPMINSTHLVSELGNMLTQEFPFSIQYFFTKDELVFSFRANDEVDLTTLSIPRGHPNSAGRSFKLKDIDLNIVLGNIEMDIGSYLIEIIRQKDKVKSTGKFRFSQDEHDRIIIGKYPIKQNNDFYFTDTAIEDILKKDTLYCEFGQPHLRNGNPSDMVKRNSTIDKTNVCAAISNIVCEKDGDVVIVKGSVKPTGPRAKELEELISDTDITFGYRGFSEKSSDGNKIVKIITFDILNKHTVNVKKVRDEQQN